MGSCFALLYACLVMSLWEARFITNLNNPFLNKIPLWKRYIDNVFFIWKGTTIELSPFMDYII